MLVQQRIKWEYEYFFGKEPWFPEYLDYKKNRDSEFWRTNVALEEFFAYVMVLEEKVGNTKDA